MVTLSVSSFFCQIKLGQIFPSEEYEEAITPLAEYAKETGDSSVVSQGVFQIEVLAMLSA